MESEPTAFKPRGFGQIIGDSFETYFSDIAKYVAIAAMVVVPVALCSGGLWALGDFARTAADGWSDPEPGLVAVLIFSIGTLLLSMSAYPLMHGALIHATRQKHLGQSISIRQAYLSALRNAGKLIGTWLVTSLLISAMMVSPFCFLFALLLGVRWLYILTAVTAIGLPFALYFTIRWLFVLQMVMLEESRVTQSLSRSSALVSGNWWRSLGIWVLLTLAPPFIVGIPVSLILAFWEQPSGLGAIVFQGIFPALVVLPLSIIAQTLLYFDLCTRREQYVFQIMGGGEEVPFAPKPEYSPHLPSAQTRQPRRLKLRPALIAVAVAIILAAVIAPTVLYFHNRADGGDIQAFVQRASTGKKVEIGHGILKTFNYTDFAFVVDFNASVRAGDEDNAIVADVKPWGGDYWVHSSAHVGVFAVKETKDDFFANGSVPERDPANEVSTTVEILDEEHILVSPEAGEFPSGSQIVLYLDFGGGSGWCARLFTP